MTARTDRRTIRRPTRPIKIPCSVQRVYEEGPWEVLVVIVSVSAIRIHAQQLFRPGMHIAIDLPTVQGPLKANLVRVTGGKERIGGPEWVVEGVFFKKLPQDEVDIVRARLPPPAPRNVPPVKPGAPTGWKTACRLVRVRDEGPWLVTLQNVSHRGIGLIAEQPFEPGVVLKVELPSLQRRHLAPKLVRVTRSAPQPDGEGWAVGGVFLRSLSEEELQVLL